MTLPVFDPRDDPGPDFIALLRTTSTPTLDLPASVEDRLTITHGTTVLAIKYDEGVVMAGDRRATAGNLIAHRTIEKVFPADRFSGVAIAGAAGPAMEMVRLFQLQLEHYEKVEGHVISLDGKANQLGQMLRSHLPAAMQGLAVVPLFAGYDLGGDTGRLFQFDVTGGRYEEADYATTGSGSLHAGTVIKLGYKPDIDRGGAIDLSLSALWEAADADSATGGPDAIRGIYPIVATITADGFAAVEEEELVERFATILDERRSRTRGGIGGDPSGGPVR